MKDNSQRWRCLVVGCNPVLGESGARDHTTSTGHRTAPWPKRSAEGRRRAQARNRSGYYDRFNVGDKARAARPISESYINEHSSDLGDKP